MIRKSLVFVFGSLLTLSGIARADGLAIEVQAGERSSDADYFLSPLFDELAKRGYATPKGGLAAQIESTISQSGDALPEAEVKAAIDLLDRGYEGWITGNFDQAVELTRQGLDKLLSAPATIARQQSLRDKTFRGYAVLGLAYKRMGDMRNASSAMAQLLRVFPDREYSRKQFGPEGHDLYLQVKAELDRAPKGTLAVTVDDPSAVVFVNGRYTAIGGAKLDNLYPGTYLVYFQKGDTPGRVHEVEVKAGEKTVVDVHWELERTLRSHGAVGLRFNEGEPVDDKVPSLAAKLGQALGQGPVVLVAVRPHAGTESIVATVVDPESGQVVRKAALPVRPNPPQVETIRALAAYVDGEEPASGIRVIDPHGGGGAPVVVDSGGTSKMRIIGGVVGGVGAATLITGGVLIAIDGKESSPGRVYETLPLGIGLSVAGAAAIGAGVYLWIQGGADEQPPQRAISAAPTQNGWLFSYAGTF